MASSLFAKVAFYPTVGYTLFMGKFSSRKYYNRIDDTVVLGALPFVWILKEELSQLGVQQLQIPTVDFVGTPSQEDIQKAVDFISQHRERKESVYVHCKAGRTRSATVVACYLVQTHNMTPEEAVRFIKSHRPHTWIRDKQLTSIRSFYNKFQKRQRS